MYGSFVRSIRTSRGVSQARLAEIAGVSQPNLSAIENDRRLPTADTLNRIVVACGYELAAVAGDKVVYCDLPHAGWFEDDLDPGPLPGDPDPGAPALAADAPIGERLAVINAVLEAAAPRAS
jgi:transcriptional regulator with XRE-family HTH domain